MEEAKGKRRQKDNRGEAVSHMARIVTMRLTFTVEQSEHLRRVKTERGIPMTAFVRQLVHNDKFMPNRATWQPATSMTVTRTTTKTVKVQRTSHQDDFLKELKAKLESRGGEINE